MPDNLDYAWLGWLIAHPNEWTPDDLAKAEELVAQQRLAVEESYPIDSKEHLHAQAVVDALESAILLHRRRHA